MNATVEIVKNMVCQRCIMAVEDILRAESIPFQKVIFGEIYLPVALNKLQKSRLQEHLRSVGFELIDNLSSSLIEKTKRLIIAKARNEVESREASKKLSQYLTDAVHHEYTYLSGLFSSIEGRTIENYFIEQRIEKAKELLVYDELSLSQIAYELDYSSVAHLSKQFKKVTVNSYFF